MDYVIGLGANLGSPRRQLIEALERLEREGLRLLRSSMVYESEAVGPPQPPYLNAAVRVATALVPAELLALLHRVERALGRVRAERWGPRTIDLDILWCEIEVTTPELTIPHAALRERWFALKPLLEVAPELVSTFGPDLAKFEPTPSGQPFWPPGCP